MLWALASAALPNNEAVLATSLVTMAIIVFFYPHARVRFARGKGGSAASPSVTGDSECHHLGGYRWFRGSWLRASGPAASAAAASSDTLSSSTASSPRISDGNSVILIAGLGNPGAQYQGTRHNAGFHVLDKFAEQHGMVWGRRLESGALVARGRIHNQPVVLCKPMTFMNVSGESVSQIARNEGLLTSQILVVYDDIDTEFGTVKLKAAGGHGGHNGMRSIIAELGHTHAFPRLKFGIGRPAPGVSVTGHVLGPFLDHELDAMQAAVLVSVARLEAVCCFGMDAALSGKLLE